MHTLQRTLVPYSSIIVSSHCVIRRDSNLAYKMIKKRMLLLLKYEYMREIYYKMFYIIRVLYLHANLSKL